MANLTTEQRILNRRNIEEFYDAITKGNGKRKKIRVFNRTLNEMVEINLQSKKETATHASRNNQSTALVEELIYILLCAAKADSSEIKSKSKSQAKFSNMIVMECDVPNKSVAKLTIGVKETPQGESIFSQYCLTAKKIKQ